MKLYFSLLLGAMLLGTQCLSGQSPCIDGMAGPYPCDNVDLMGFLPLDEIGGGNNTNDIWGWTDLASGREFAIVGRNSGTSFIEISDPTNPIYVGDLPTHTTNSLWRDVKVYSDHAFIVSEANQHGMQVFDLSRLLTEENMPAIFEADAHYSGFGKAHNIVINEESGFAYAVGTTTFEGGLHIVNIQNPLLPQIAGDFAADGYTHDAQVINYDGPDPDYCGKEIAFASNENTLTIVDVDDKQDTYMIASVGYDESAYTHQCWITEDHRYVLVNDELDELQGLADNTRTYIFDVTDLDNPSLVGQYDGVSTSIDHNLYIRWNQVFQSNYRSGLRILDAARVAEGSLQELGFFDTQPDDDDAVFSGSWSNYPYFPSGNVVLTDMYTGFFVVQPHIATAQERLEAFLGSTSVRGEIYIGYPSEIIELDFIGLPAGWTAELTSFDTPGTVEYELSIPDGAEQGNVSFSINLAHDAGENSFPVDLEIVDVEAPGFTAFAVNEMDYSNFADWTTEGGEGALPFPGDAGPEDAENTLFSWDFNREGFSYQFSLAFDEAFEDLIYEESSDVPSIQMPFSLPYTPDDQGAEYEYVWQVTASGPCGESFSSPVIHFSFITTHVMETELEKMTLFPIPARDVLQINGHGAFRNARILNAVGQVVKSCTELEGRKQGWVSIQDLSVGHYVFIDDLGQAARFVKH